MAPYMAEEANRSGGRSTRKFAENFQKNSPKSRMSRKAYHWFEFDAIVRFFRWSRAKTGAGAGPRGAAALKGGLKPRVLGVF
jgi:hypothetical protein